jgi:hypothetical protein
MGGLHTYRATIAVKSHRATVKDKQGLGGGLGLY